MAQSFHDYITAAPPGTKGDKGFSIPLMKKEHTFVMPDMIYSDDIKQILDNFRVVISNKNGVPEYDVIETIDDLRSYIKKAKERTSISNKLKRINEEIARLEREQLRIEQLRKDKRELENRLND